MDNNQQAVFSGKARTSGNVSKPPKKPKSAMYYFDQLGQPVGGGFTSASSSHSLVNGQPLVSMTSHDVQQLFSIAERSISINNQYRSFSLNSTDLITLGNAINGFNQRFAGVQAFQLPQLAQVAATTPMHVPFISATNTSSAQQLLQQMSIQLPLLPSAEAGNSNLATDEAPNRSTRTTTDKYRCVQCNRRFVSSYNLNRHLKVHAGVKPFRCPEAVCGKEFTYEDHLKRHAITHSADSRTMVCSICKMSFNRKFNFSRHLTKVHKISDSLHSNRLK